VWVEAWGWLDESDDVTLPAPKYELVDCAASSLIRAETPRVPLDVAVLLPESLPACVPPRTTTDRIPKPTTATPADAIFRSRARRRAGARREEGVEDMPP
jgi:hypothetical protein